MLRQTVFGLCGGLGLFIYGMQLMGDGLQKAVGDRMRRMLEILTNNPCVGVLVGASVTAVIQSSSATTVMVVGFVNAGLMNLNQAIGVIMGANIGTTMTAQLIAFRLESYALPIIALGVGLSLVSKRKLGKYIGLTLLGFGMLFFGMWTMMAAVRPLRDWPFFTHAMVAFSRNPLLGVLVGTVFTGVVQSSSATIGVIQALAGLGLLELDAAMGLLFGCNIGTCVTALLASVGTSLSARRAALFHLMFNVFGTLLFLPLLRPFALVVKTTGGDLVRQIANAHTMFNVSNTLIQLPLMNFLVAVVLKLLPGAEVVMERGMKYLDERLLETPAVAVRQAVKELCRMGGLVVESLEDAIDGFLRDDRKLLKTVLQREEVINDLEKQVTTYLVRLSQGSLTESQSQKLTGLLSAVSDIERVGDHARIIGELAAYSVENRLPFSAHAMEELETMFLEVRKIFLDALEALESDKVEAARRVVKQEDAVDRMEKELRNHHIQRLNEGKCYPASGVVYLDVISSLERVADHSADIAFSVLGKA